MWSELVCIVSERFGPEELYLPCILCKFGRFRDWVTLFTYPSTCITFPSAYGFTCDHCWLCSLQGDFHKTMCHNKKRGGKMDKEVMCREERISLEGFG